MEVDDKVVIFPLGNMKGNLVALKAGRDCNYFEQNVPLGINLTKTITNSSNNLEFIAWGTRGASGLISTDDTKVQKVFLVILGTVANTYAGSNALDCIIPSYNQWQVDLDMGGWTDLMNGSNPDGQMLDNDWRCPTEGGIQTFAFQFDVTSKITNIDGNIGLLLASSYAEQVSLIVTLSAFLKILWKM